MLIPVSWLKEYVDITIPVDELAELLTNAGMEVEHINYIGIPGGTDKDRLVWDRDLLVMGHIHEVIQHPNADRLVVATIDYGADEPEGVVTGAPNLFQFLGQGNISAQNIYAPLALEGATVYDGHKEGQKKMKLKGKELRGIYNKSMVCSEKELGLSEEHEGIMLMQGDYVAGTPIQDVLGDAVIEIAIIPNIARAASILGVARETAALTGATLNYPSLDVVQEGPSIDGKVLIKTDEPELNPRFVAYKIDGVDSTKESPAWMQQRLRLAGMRPINVIVDISNYVMLETGQPNHTFDYDFLRERADAYAPDGPITIHTRMPEDGETLTTLDGVEHKLKPFNLLVADPAGNLSLGGIMGGANSDIKDSTTSVLLEAAAWNFINIRQSATALKINTDAGFRFSRGVHPAQAMVGAKRAAELLRTVAGGTVAKGVIDFEFLPSEPVVIDFYTKEVKRLGGITVPKKKIIEMLESLEFTVADKDKFLQVTVPDHRLDVTGSHDLVEEVCRMYGYDRIPTTLMSDNLPTQRGNPEMEVEEHVRDIMAELGLQEIITYTMTTPEREALLIPKTADNPPSPHTYVTLKNPSTVERTVMRQSLLGSALDIAAENSKFQERIAIFEVARVYLGSEEAVLPNEVRRLAMVMQGKNGRSHFSAAAPENMDFYDIKGIVEGLLAALNITHGKYAAAEHPTFRPGRTASLSFNDKIVGYFGELHPLVIEALDIRGEGAVLSADFDLDLLLKNIPAVREIDPIPTFPPVVEDLALIVDKHLEAGAVADVINKSGGFLLKGVDLFDIYEGDSIPEDKKSLAFHLTFQSPNKTLTDKDVAKMRKKILGQLKGRIGATLRE